MQPNYPGMFILIRDKTLDNTARKPMTFSSVATSQRDFLKGRPMNTSVGGMIFSTTYSTKKPLVDTYALASEPCKVAEHSGRGASTV